MDDDERTRSYLAELVRGVASLRLLSDHANAAAALAALPGLRPEVVLMDINMPGLNGVECVRQLRPQLPTTQFLMLTVYEDDEHIFAALAAGATGYLLKSTGREELLTAIAQIAGGGSPMSSSIARKVVRSFSRPASSAGSLAELSPRERTVLSLLSEGYLYKEIADNLGISSATVDTYIRRIYEKLQVHTRSQAIARYLGR